jgi:hypothetical protein
MADATTQPSDGESDKQASAGDLMVDLPAAH